MQDDAVRVEGGAGVEALGLAPGEEILDVLGRDMPGIGLGGRVFGEELEDGLVFLVGERLAEGLDIVEKDLDRSYSGPS